MDANEIPEEFKMGTGLRFNRNSCELSFYPAHALLWGNNDLNYIPLIISSLVVYPRPPQLINTLLCTI